MKHYVYTHAYPDGTVFYVGKGTGDRIYQHVSEARRGVDSLKCEIIRSILAKGEKVLREKVAEFDNEQDAFIYEWGLINLIYGYDNLANVCEGGNGGVVERTRLYKQVTIMLSEEVVNALPGTLTGYIRNVLSVGLSDKKAIDTLVLNPIIPSMLTIKPRRNFGVQLSLDLFSRWQYMPSGLRSAVVEFLLRSEIGLPILDN